MGATLCIHIVSSIACYCCLCTVTCALCCVICLKNEDVQDCHIETRMRLVCVEMLLVHSLSCLVALLVALPVLVIWSVIALLIWLCITICRCRRIPGLLILLLCLPLGG